MANKLLEYKSLVKAVAQEVTKTPEESLPLVLLKLLPCLQARTLSAEDFSSIKYEVWKEDLVHLLIEVLRNDYSSMVDHWRIFTNLAVLLSSMLAGLSPSKYHLSASKKKSTSHEAREDEETELQDIVLPTAVDSILILSNSILEAADENSKPVQTGSVQENTESLKECFKKTLDTLLWLCAGQKSCISRVLQSPYFLHVLITDNTSYGYISLGILETLVLSDKAAISSIPQAIFTSILDELIYKLSGKDKNGALLALRLLAHLVDASPEVLDVLLASYSSLLPLVSKWVELGGATEAKVKQFVKELEVREGEHVGVSNEVAEKEQEHKSAIVIQSHLRGYLARKRVKKIKRGITKFQQLYRRRKLLKERKKIGEEKAKAEESIRKQGQRSSKLAFHEKQLALLEQLPASELQEYTKRQEKEAAVKIQCAWRSWVSRSRFKRQKSELLVHKSAMVIQRAMRKNLLTKREPEQHLQEDVLPKITGAQREKLQSEIAMYRELHPTTGYKSEEQVAELHDKVQKLYEEFYISRPTQRKEDEKADLMLSQLGRNVDFLSNLPTLEQFAKDPQPDLVERLSSSSASIARMAKRAHREELKALNTPWWKQPLDQDELSV